MACLKHCDPKTAQIIHAGIGNLTLLNNDGAYVTRGTPEKAIDYASDGDGNVYSAGTGETMEEFTAYSNCTGEAQLIDALYKSTKLPLCGPGSIVDECCGESVFKTLILLSVKTPDIGEEVGYYEFNYRGYYAAV